MFRVWSRAIGVVGFWYSFDLSREYFACRRETDASNMNRTEIGHIVTIALKSAAVGWYNFISDAYFFCGTAPLLFYNNNCTPYHVGLLHSVRFRTLADSRVIFRIIILCFLPLYRDENHEWFWFTHRSI